MVVMETAPLERHGERQMVWPAPTALNKLQLGGHGGGGGFQIRWKCRRFSESVQNNTGWLHLATLRAGDNLRNLGRALYGRGLMPRGPKCVRHGVDWC